MFSVPHFVLSILELSPKIEVRWPYALSIIAPMEDVQSSCRTSQHFVGNFMSILYETLA